MSFQVRDGKFHVVIAAAPGVYPWPTVGVLELSKRCSKAGLEVGFFGDENIRVRGVLPLPVSGAILLAEDIRHRIHRIHAQAVVRISPHLFFPDPFPGWRSTGMIPLLTAELLKKNSILSWDNEDNEIAILGSGNRALRFASSLLESGTRKVYCIESYLQWGAKRFAGWEVERRRFEMLGGELIEAKPINLAQKSGKLWELSISELGCERGCERGSERVLEVRLVISAGPFQDTSLGIREYPSGSLLFELEQSAQKTYLEDVEGWNLEKERGKVLAGKVIKALTPHSNQKQRTLSNLRGAFKHRLHPFIPAYQGKWLASIDLKNLRSFKGVPKEQHQKRLVASIECFEEISCRQCELVCPEKAIEKGRVLKESSCTACGLCVETCPSGSIVMLWERPEQSLSLLLLPWRGKSRWATGDSAILVNRKGESLESTRVGLCSSEVSEVSSEVFGKSSPNDSFVQIVQLEIPTHLLWQVRSLKRKTTTITSDEHYLAALTTAASAEGKVEVTINSEKRFIRDQIPISMALFEIGQNRPDDVLHCADGSCKLCQLQVDGIKKLACQTLTHRGMNIEFSSRDRGNNINICQCLNISRDQVLERIQMGKLQSPEAILSATHVGEGKCHGQLCMDTFKRILHSLNEDGTLHDHSQWIDWRFPWSAWILNRS